MSDPYAAPKDGTAINLSLISHTNAGKTTLVRTLLGQDVGEVRDAAHVTGEATPYVLLQSGPDTLLLWDTPGFGDTARLLKRLKLSRNPVGWFLTQVWDRFRERPLWSSQQAVRNARDHADVILYLVNASEDPDDAGYVGLEMEILAWIGKPVILLLNQMGPPRLDAGAEEERWERHLKHHEVVRGALTLDAFARCWVQEGVLLRTVAPLLPADRRPALDRLSAAWQDKNLTRFRASMAVLARQLAEAAVDREDIGEQNTRDRLAGALRTLRQEEAPESRRAMQQLAERLEAGTVRSTEQLIDLHHLKGKAAREVMRRLQKDYASSAPAKEGFAAIIGGLMSGAAGGLAADVVAGGLTLGGGMIVGGILGALGAGGLARGYNMVRGEGDPSVRWSDEFLQCLVRLALLRYLAVAHFGRGRGDYEESEHPAFWEEAVKEVVERRQSEFRTIWKQGRAGDLEPLAGPLETLLIECASDLLVRFYPEARQVAGLRASASPSH
ncbi:MAG TPA: DUF3482 domain-containing protein [Allosphingosinicella sp.]|nr:DUF3482 domain-containing protein [Allosphingosinicella sp.]